MSKVAKTIKGIPTETTNSCFYNSGRELSNPGLTLRNLHKTEPDPLNVGDGCAT